MRQHERYSSSVSHLGEKKLLLKGNNFKRESNQRGKTSEPDIADL